MLQTGIIGKAADIKRCTDLLQSLRLSVSRGFFVTLPTLEDEALLPQGLFHVAVPQELFSMSDALLFLGEDDRYAEWVRETLRAGKHVYVECPQTIPMEDFGNLADMAQEANVQCMFGLSDRFNPAFMALQQNGVNPLFIETERQVLYNPQDHTGSVVMDQMLPDIDLVLHLVNSEVKRISATGAKVIGETADIANARLEFANGCVANLTVNRIAMEKKHEIKVFLSESYYSLNLETPKADRVYFMDHPSGPVRQEIVAAIAANETGLIAIEHVSLQTHSALENSLSYFADSIQRGSGTIAGPYECRMASETALKILKKINSFGEEQ